MREDLDEYIVLALTGRASPEDLAHLESWRQSSAANDRYVQEFAALWRLTGEHPAAQLRGDVPKAQDVLASRVTQAAPSARSESHRRRSGGTRMRRRLAGVAAALVLAAAGGYFAFASDAAEVATAEFRTGPTELSTVVLDDGTMVRLAPSSRLSVTLEGESREAHLTGRAFFAVSPDPDRPFDVHTDDGVVRVLGTRFDLESTPGDDGTRLLVLDGEVALTTPSGRSHLQAGDLAITSERASPSIQRVEQPERMLDWMGAWVAFEGTRLDRVARELEVRLGVTIEIADPEIAERTVVGWFAQEERQAMIEMVCRVADVECRWIEGRVVMNRRAR